MRHVSVRILLAALALAACSDNPSQPTGPVTLRFVADTVDGVEVLGHLVLDDTIPLTIPGTVFGIPRGQHRIRGRLNVDYLPFDFTFQLNPGNSDQTVHALELQEPSCRLIAVDVQFCAQSNSIYWANHTRLFCPASDFGEFCTVNVDAARLGLTWPDSAAVGGNAYLSHGKLLIGAIMGSEIAGSEGDTLATAFAIEGDYSPRRRLHVVGNDSTRWQAEVWTDVRRLPLYIGGGAFSAVLDTNDRRGNNFGLAVRVTAYLPPAQQNALLLRYDVTNISASDSFRFVHPEEPVGGHTLTNIYLTPFFDADIGGRTQGTESSDDNATVFMAESLLVTYDQAFNVTTFAGPYRTAPGLFGVQLISGPPGTTAKAVITSQAINLTYESNALEDSTYAIISGGRAGVFNATRCPINTSQALICGGETAYNARAGWSLGPIPELGPGQSTSVTVGVLLQPPKTGTFVSGTAVPPEQNRLNDPTRPIYNIAEHLRALAAQTKTIGVNGTPGLQ